MVFDAAQRVHGPGGVPDVVRCCSAATADTACTKLDVLLGVLSEVLGIGKVEGTAFDFLGKSGVGHQHKRLVGHRNGMFGGAVERCRAGAAVHADAAHMWTGSQGWDNILNAAALGGLAVDINGERRHDRQSGLRRGFRGQQEFVDICERLKHDEIHAPFGEGGCAFAKGCLHILPVIIRQDLAGTQAGAYGTRHVYVISGGFACKPCAGEVDVDRLFRQAVAAQPDAVCPERVGLDDVGPGRDVLLMDATDEVRIG